MNRYISTAAALGLVAIFGWTGSLVEVSYADDSRDYECDHTECEQFLNKARRIVRKLKRELAPVEEEIRNAPFLDELESGAVTVAQLQAFACEEFNIVSSDIESNKKLVNRDDIGLKGKEFFDGILEGEIIALQLITDFGAALGLSGAELAQCKPRPGGQGFPQYVALLAEFANQADVAAAFLLNFPIFGENTGRMAITLQMPPYNLSPEDVAFFTFFATPIPNFEEDATEVIAEGFRHGGARTSLIKRSTRFLQQYELLFWITVGEDL